MKSTIVRNAALAAAMLVPVSAFAQTQGAGFPIGEKSRIHTNLDLGVAFDSNPDRIDAGGTVNSDWKALIRPGVNVNVPGSSLSFDLKSQLTINQFFGTNAESATTFGLLFGTNLQAGGRNAVVGFKLDNQLVRTPAYLDDAGTIAAEERLFKSWSDRGTASLYLRPGGGALEFNLGYTTTITGFDETLPFAQRHGAVLEAKLRFLPKTAAVFHSDISFFSTDNDSTTDVSSPYNITLGLIGQITPRISTNLAVGLGDTLTWSDGFFSTLNPENQRTLIATVEGTYDITESSRVMLGYRRQVQPVILLDNYRRDSLYLRAIVGIGARLALGAFVNYEFRDYAGDALAPPNLEAPEAQVLTVDGRIDYWFFEYLSASLNYRLLKQTGQSTPATGLADERLLQNYARHEFFVMAGLHY